MLQLINRKRRNHRAKTMTFQLNHPSIISENKIELLSLKTQIAKVDKVLGKHNRQNRVSSAFRAGSAKRTVLSLRKDNYGQKSLVYQMMDRCNNETLVGRLLEERGRWVKSENKFGGETQFIWGYVSMAQSAKLKGKEVVSRIRGSSQMTDKGRLYENITSYCDKTGISYSFLPITFFLDRDGPTYLLKQNIKEFIDFFVYITMNTTLHNTWILKPTNMNQGRDIHLFNSLPTLLKQMNYRSFDSIPKIQQCSTNLQTQAAKLIQDYILKNKSLVLQKYIQNPLVLQGHKFDIRMWVLVDHIGNFYLFQEGYLRFTSEPYKLDQATITNNFMHLTNHSLQKHSPLYSKNHNLQSMAILEEYLRQHSIPQAFDKIMESIKNIISISIHSCLQNPIKRRKNNSFQIFGFDFLIDRQLNVRLIEANCNPAITEDCPLLSELIPKMLNDAFKLTIDKIYNTRSSRLYHVARLSSQNSWLHLGKIMAD